MLQNIFSYIKKNLIDTHSKTGAEITDIVFFRKKLLKFLQGVNGLDRSQLICCKHHCLDINIGTVHYKYLTIWIELC